MKDEHLLLLDKVDQLCTDLNKFIGDGVIAASNDSVHLRLELFKEVLKDTPKEYVDLTILDCGSIHATIKRVNKPSYVAVYTD